MSLLYINPGPVTSDEPVIDDLTRKMTAAFRGSEDSGIRWRGFHTCRCGVFSSNTEYILEGGMQTNSLCVHYLAWHRDEVPLQDLTLVSKLNSGEAEPTIKELEIPVRSR